MTTPHVALTPEQQSMIDAIERRQAQLWARGHGAADLIEIRLTERDALMALVRQQAAALAAAEQRIESLQSTLGDVGRERAVEWKRAENAYKNGREEGTRAEIKRIAMMIRAAKSDIPDKAEVIEKLAAAIEIGLTLTPEQRAAALPLTPEQPSGQQPAEDA